MVGKLSNCIRLWAAPPHYHHKHNVSTSTSESKPRAEGTRNLVHTPVCPRQQAWLSPRKTSSNNASAHPPQQQHGHANEPCLKYSNCSLPTTMCRPNAPTKTHACSDWVKGDTECQTNHTPQQPTAHSDQTFPFAIALIAPRPSRPHTQTNKTCTRLDRAPPQPTAHSKQ